MKILQVITSLRVGGAETLVVNLVTRLRTAGYQADVCILDNLSTPLIDRLLATNPGVKLYKLGKGLPPLLYLPPLSFDERL